MRSAMVASPSTNFVPSLRDSLQSLDSFPGLTSWAKEFHPGRDRVGEFGALDTEYRDASAPRVRSGVGMTKVFLATGNWRLATASSVQFHSEQVTLTGSIFNPWRCASLTRVAGE